MLFIYAYKNYSKSAKALGYRRIRHTASKFRHTPNKTVINWGAQDTGDRVDVARVLNKPEAVKVSANKRTFFRYNEVVGGGRTPDWTECIDSAIRWIEGGHTVVCRTLLNSCGGKGIVIASKIEELVRAPLYVKYKKKHSEHRIHIFQGDVFDMQRKVRDKDVPDDDVNWQVRNCVNGFIFQRNDLDIPKDVIDQALKSFSVCGLDFGAVDVIWNEKEGKAYVLEINTAPGLTGTTLEKYQEVFENYDNKEI